MAIPTKTKVMIEMVSIEIPLLFSDVCSGEHEKRRDTVINRYPNKVFSFISVFL